MHDWERAAHVAESHYPESMPDVLMGQVRKKMEDKMAGCDVQKVMYDFGESFACGWEGHCWETMPGVLMAQVREKKNWAT